MNANNPLLIEDEILSDRNTDSNKLTGQGRRLSDTIQKSLNIMEIRNNSQERKITNNRSMTQNFRILFIFTSCSGILTTKFRKFKPIHASWRCE